MPSKKHKQFTFNHEHTDAILDLTPLIDILFVLILFFMLIVGANIQSINVALPQAPNSGENLTKNFTIEITNNNEYVIANNHKFTSVNQLSHYLKKYTTNKSSILIAADKDSKSEKLVQLMSMLQQEGYNTANIALQK
ncbi:Biopolymer transport protein ExbD [Candidatus Hepatincola sp. Pdp]